MNDMPIPPKSVSEHNARSAHNGIIGEKYAEIHYQTIVCQNALIDAEYMGRPLEVKTCQVWIYDGCNARKRRRGRYYLRKDQHKVLVSKNGFYAFVLLNKEGKVLFSKLVDASTISMGNRENWQIPWFRIFDDFDYKPNLEAV